MFTDSPVSTLRAGEVTVHLREGWHRETEWMNVFYAPTGPTANAG